MRIINYFLKPITYKSYPHLFLKLLKLSLLAIPALIAITLALLISPVIMILEILSMYAYKVKPSKFMFIVNEKMLMFLAFIIDTGENSWLFSDDLPKKMEIAYIKNPTLLSSLIETIKTPETMSVALEEVLSTANSRKSEERNMAILKALHSKRAQISEMMINAIAESEGTENYYLSSRYRFTCVYDEFVELLTHLTSEEKTQNIVWLRELYNSLFRSALILSLKEPSSISVPIYLSEFDTIEGYLYETKLWQISEEATMERLKEEALQYITLNHPESLPLPEEWKLEMFKIEIERIVYEYVNTSIWKNEPEWLTPMPKWSNLEATYGSELAWRRDYV